MKALIFDMDNTLVLTENLHESAMIKTFQLYGVNINLSSYKNLSGAKQIERMDSIATDIGLVVNAAGLDDARKRYDTICDCLEFRGEMQSSHKEFSQLRMFGFDSIMCWDHQSGNARKELLQTLDDQRKMIFSYLLSKTELSPLPGVEKFLREATVPKALASSSSQVEILKTLAKAGLYYDTSFYGVHTELDKIWKTLAKGGLYTPEKKYFDVLASGYEVAKGKPAPDVFLLAAKRLKVEPEDCIIFEDSRNGVLAAKNAGMKCVAIPVKGANEDVSLADLVVGSFEELDLERVSRL